MVLVTKRAPEFSKSDLIRIAAEEDLVTFIRLIAPHRVLGRMHEDLCRWWTRDDCKTHQLVLLPRDHQKSAMMAYRVAWEITRDPSITVLYISSTANLAEKQLKAIKDILTSRVYKRYWPEMVNDDEGKRELWNVSEIAVDHPKRRAEGVRDPTVFTAGLTTSITGLHCSISVMDDVVVQENAYTKEGREKTKMQYSLLASVESADAREWVVGTRYHPDDLYGNLMDMALDIRNEDGDLIDESPVYELYKREVEDRGDGTGEYLWPRQQRNDGRWFGFNQEILSKKKAQYLDRTQFFAQYYNDPNPKDEMELDPSLFQYYDRKHLENSDGRWWLHSRALNVFAAVDFAFSLNAKADFTAIVVIGIDSQGMIYVLDIDRFKTNKISEYFDRIKLAHVKWGFRRIRAEATVAQEAIVEALKENIRQDGLALSIDKYKPSFKEGTKEERIRSCINPRYENRSVWHYKAGVIDDLEMELVSSKPRHDDIKDALANAITIAIPPSAIRGITADRKVVTHKRFGGVAF